MWIFAPLVHPRSPCTPVPQPMSVIPEWQNVRRSKLFKLVSSFSVFSTYCTVVHACSEVRNYIHIVEIIVNAIWTAWSHTIVSCSYVFLFTFCYHWRWIPCTSSYWIGWWWRGLSKPGSRPRKPLQFSIPCNTSSSSSKYPPLFNVCCKPIIFAARKCSLKMCPIRNKNVAHCRCWLLFIYVLAQRPACDNDWALYITEVGRDNRQRSV